MSAAKRFFSRAAKQHGAPRVITLDGYAASHRAVAQLKTSGIIRPTKTYTLEILHQNPGIHPPLVKRLQNALSILAEAR
jgi:transposase-like protein